VEVVSFRFGNLGSLILKLLLGLFDVLAILRGPLLEVIDADFLSAFESIA
jgi:hypothetical protein